MRISGWSSDVCSSDLSGSMTLEQALNRALGGSGLGWTRVNATTVTIQKSPSTTPKWKEDKPTSRSVPVTDDEARVAELRSEEHTSELQSLMRNSYAVFCLKNKKSKT